jgi:hypothetical protein
MRTRHAPDLIRQHFAERKSKHLTFAQLTERTGIPLHVYRHRITQDKRHSIQEESGAAGPSSFVEVVPSSLNPNLSSIGIEIRLANDLQIHLAKDFDADTMQRLLSIVRC